MHAARKPGREPAGAVSGEVWSGNFAIKAKFDAARWMRLMDNRHLGALAADEWRGVGATSELIRFFAASSEEVALVVDYAQRRHTALHFSLDPQAALEWIRTNRPGLELESAIRAPLAAPARKFG